MKILIYYHHGLGDCIILTPQLRYFYNKYHAKMDLMCRKSVKKSKLFHNCPYINRLITIPNPWKGNFVKLLKRNKKHFKSIKSNYNKAFFIDHIYMSHTWHKMQVNSLKCKINTPINLQPEIFISNNIQKEAQKFINNNYPNGYIFKHTNIELHPNHNWKSDNWIKDNLPNLPIINTGHYQKDYKIKNNINFTFYLISKAKHLVLSSSVMVHAADALKKNIDVLNKGNKTPYDLPFNKNIINKLRINKTFVKPNRLYSHLRVYKNNPNKLQKLLFLSKEQLKKILILLRNL